MIATAADELPRRHEELGFSFFVLGASARTLALVDAELTGR